MPDLTPYDMVSDESAQEMIQRCEAHLSLEPLYCDAERVIAGLARQLLAAREALRYWGPDGQAAFDHLARGPGEQRDRIARMARLARACLPEYQEQSDA